MYISNLQYRIKTIVILFLKSIVITTLSGLLSTCTGDSNLPTKEKPPQKISSPLTNALKQLKSQPETEKKSLSTNSKTVRIDEEGKIQIYIKLFELNDLNLEDLKKHGVKIDIYDGEKKLVQGWALPGQIKLISELPYVKFIDLPTYGVSN